MISLASLSRPSTPAHSNKTLQYKKPKEQIRIRVCSLAFPTDAPKYRYKPFGQLAPVSPTDSHRATLSARARQLRSGTGRLRHPTSIVAHRPLHRNSRCPTTQPYHRNRAADTRSAPIHARANTPQLLENVQNPLRSYLRTSWRYTSSALLYPARRLRLSRCHPRIFIPDTRAISNPNARNPRRTH